MTSDAIDFRMLGGTALRCDGRDRSTVLTGARGLGLFAYLVLARPRGGHRRAEVLSLFWPDRGERNARHALSTVRSDLRQALGEDLIVSRDNEKLKVRRDRLFCDAVAFEDRLERGDLEGALRLYRGPLLPGVHVPGAAPAFEHWLAHQRTRFRLHAAEGAWALAEEAERAGHLPEARDWADRSADLMPYADHAKKRLVAFLRRVGDRAGVLRAYDVFAERLRAEWGIDPEIDLIHLVNKMDDPTPMGDV